MTLNVEKIAKDLSTKEILIYSKKILGGNNHSKTFNLYIISLPKAKFKVKIDDDDISENMLKTKDFALPKDAVFHSINTALFTYNLL